MGDMGGPMAMRVCEAGFPMTVYDVRPEAMAPYLEKGATGADSPKAVAEAISARGGDGNAIADVETIVDFVGGNAQSGDVVIVFSNGAFGGIHGKLLHRFEVSDPKPEAQAG